MMWVPGQNTRIELDTVFDAFVTNMYDLYRYMNKVIIVVAGHEFSLWNMVIGAMILAALTAAAIPESPMADSFTVPDEAAEFYDAGYFDG